MDATPDKKPGDDPPSRGELQQPVISPLAGFSKVLATSSGIALIILGIFLLIANSGGSFAASLAIGLITAALGFALLWYGVSER